MLGKHENMSNFEVVHITNIYKKDTKICNSINDNVIQLMPVLDVDAHDNEIDISDIKSKINELFILFIWCSYYLQNLKKLIVNKGFNIMNI